MIPNIIHFCFGFKKDFGGKPFSYVHYLAVLTALKVNKPERIHLYYHYEPTGHWWKEAKKLIHPIKIIPPTEVFGNILYHPAHQADVTRMQVLMEQGGIYLDMDVVCLKPFAPLLNHDVVMGYEKEDPNEGLCNAVILSKPQSDFLHLWFEEFRRFRSKGFDEYWGEISVVAPGKLSKQHPHLLHIESNKSFFWPYCHNPEPLWTNQAADFSQSYSIHLWEMVWWNPYLKDLSPESIEKSDSNFARLLKPLVL